MKQKLCYKLFLYLIIASTFILMPLSQSCKKTIVKDVPFPIEKKIFADSFQVPPVIYASHPGLVITGKKLVIIETQAGKIFEVFSVPDFKYIGGFGASGRGPEEFQNINTYSASATENGLRIFDFEKGILEIDFTNFPVKATSSNIITFPFSVQYMNSPFQINDSIICGIPYPQAEIINGQPETRFIDNLYIRFNANSKRVDYFGNYPDLYPKKYSDQFWIIYMNMTTVKPDKQKFASAGYLIKTLHIYNNDGTLAKELIMKVPDDLLAEESLNPKITYYDAIKSTDNYIYAICEDAPPDNLLNNIPTLEVWDWNGNPVMRFKLDRPVAAFDVTKDDKTIYFLDRQSRDKILKYDLTGLLK